MINIVVIVPLAIAVVGRDVAAAATAAAAAAAAAAAGIVHHDRLGIPFDEPKTAIAG